MSAISRVIIIAAGLLSTSTFAMADSNQSMQEAAGIIAMVVPQRIKTFKEMRKLVSDLNDNNPEWNQLFNRVLPEQFDEAVFPRIGYKNNWIFVDGEKTAQIKLVNSKQQLFSVNGQDFRIDNKLSPLQNYENLDKRIRSSKTSDFLDLFVPRAQAQVPQAASAVWTYLTLSMMTYALCRERQHPMGQAACAVSSVLFPFYWVFRALGAGEADAAELLYVENVVCRPPPTQVVLKTTSRKTIFIAESNSAGVISRVSKYILPATQKSLKNSDSPDRTILMESGTIKSVEDGILPSKSTEADNNLVKGLTELNAACKADPEKVQSVVAKLFGARIPRNDSPTTINSAK